MNRLLDSIHPIHPIHQTDMLVTLFINIRTNRPEENVHRDETQCNTHIKSSSIY